MKKHLLLLFSCSLLVGEASYASKRLREGDTASEPSEKRPRLEKDYKKIIELMYDDPNTTLENPRLLDLFVEGYYTSAINAIPKNMSLGFFKKVSQMEDRNPFYDYIFNNIALFIKRKPSLHKKNFEYLKEKKQAGDVTAKHALAKLHALGSVFMDGEVLAQDHDMAFSLFMEGALENHHPSQLSLAVMLHNGWTKRNGETQIPDPVQAAFWYEKAANQGNPLAMNDLAMMHLNGWTDNNGTREGNETFALDLLRRAASMGDFEAMFTLAKKHLKPWTDRNGAPHAAQLNYAYELLYQGAYLGDMRAQQILLDWYEKGWVDDAGVKHAPNPDEAFEALTAWNKRGSSFAQFHLGHFYRNGWTSLNGTKHAPDMVRAEALYTKAIRGDLEWGNLFLLKKYMDVNAPHAITLCKEAADQNNHQTQAVLGSLYCTGKEGALSKDPDQALHYLMMSASQKNSFAQQKVKTFFDKSNLSNALPHHFGIHTLNEKLDALLLQMDYLKAISHPKGGFQDSAPNELLHQNMSTLIEDIRCLKGLLGCMNTPGFMMSRIRTTLDNEERPLCEKTTSYFVLDGRAYLCAGRDNIQKADTLVDLLAKLKAHPSLYSCLGGYQQLKIHTNEGDEDGIKHCDEMVAKFMSWNTLFNNMACDIRTGIKSHAQNRTVDFVKEMGL